MTTNPDPQRVRELAERYARRHLANIDHGDILDEMLVDEQFAHLMTGDEDRDIATLDPIAAEIKDVAKAAALSWPDEQPQDDGGPDDSFAMVAEGAPAGPARNVANHWNSYAVTINEGCPSPEWAAVAHVTACILMAMDAENEQPQDVRDGDGAAGRVTAFCDALDHYGDDGNPIASEHNPDGDPDTALYLTLTKQDLRAVLAERDEARARLAEIGRPTEWGQPRTEWTWSARKPDGTAIPPMFPDPPPRTEDEVRREFDGVVDNMGYRNVLLRREVTAWRDAKPADAAQDGLSATETEAEGAQAREPSSNSSASTAGLSERCPCGCPKIGDGCNCRFCNEPYPTQQPEDGDRG